MKKITTILALVAGLSVGYSQGTVDFNNNHADFVTTAPTAANGHADRFVYDTNNTSKLTSTNWLAQLYYNAGANQSEGSLHTISGDVGSKFRVTTTANPGTWSGGGKTFSDVDASQTATLQVRVWDGSLFSSYALAVAGNGITGKSALFNYTVPAAGTLDTKAFYIEGLQSFTIGNVPEPTTIALGVLGAASLFVVRRRK